jgi:hypothetical protein
LARDADEPDERAAGERDDDDERTHERMPPCTSRARTA